MKRITILTLAALAATSVFAVETPDKSKQAKTPPPPKIPFWETTFYKKQYGGNIIQPGSMKGRIAFFDETDSKKEVDSVVSEIKAFWRVDVMRSTLGISATIENAEKLISENGATVGVFLISRDDYPVLLSAPQNRWSIVNVKKLKADSPDPAKLSRRIMKEVWRAFAYTCGGGGSSIKGCVMNPSYSLEDIDRLETTMISPEGGAGMSESMKKLGITPCRRVTYRAACMEGWAPSPTNEFQKAIWEEVHKLPTNPLPLVKPAK